MGSRRLLPEQGEIDAELHADPAPAARVPVPSAVVDSPRGRPSVHRLEHLKRQVWARIYEVGLMLRSSHGSCDRPDLRPEHQTEKARHGDGNCNGNEPAHVNRPPLFPAALPGDRKRKVNRWRARSCVIWITKSRFSDRPPATPKDRRFLLYFLYAGFLGRNSHQSRH